MLVATHDPHLLEAADTRVALGEAPCRPGDPRPAPAGRAAPATWAGLAVGLGRRGRVRQLLTAALGAILLGALVLAAGLARGAHDVVVEDLLGGLPAGQLRVTPVTVSIGPVRLSLGKAGARLDDERVAQLGAIDGVVAVHPQVFADFPATARIDLGGVGLATDVVLEGLTAEQLAGDVAPAEFSWTPGQAEPVPLVFSQQLLVLYNAGFAPGRGLPRLSERALLGMEATATLGSGGDRRRQRARVVAISSDVAPAGATVPASFVRAMSEALGGAVPDWTSARLVLADDADPSAVRRAAEDLGLRVDDEGGLQGARDAVALLQTGGRWAAGLLFGTAAALLALVLATRLEGRRRSLDALQVAGLSSGGGAAVVATETAAVATAGVVAAGALAWLAGAALEGALEEAFLTTFGLAARDLVVIPPMAVALLAATVPVVVLAVTLRAVWYLRRPLARRLDSD